MAGPSFDLSAAVGAISLEDMAGIGDIDDDGNLIKPEEDDPAPATTDAFFENLAEKMNESQRTALTLRLTDAIERDKKSREKRDAQYADGIKRSGMTGKGTAPAFENASVVHHPIMAECCVDYMSRVSKELLPPEKLVKYTIRPEVLNPRTEAKARRKADHMNWQLLREAPSFVPEMEKLLTQQPLGGVGYIRIWYEQDYKRFEFQFYPADWAFIPYGARSFYAARRKTFLEPITTAEYQDRIDEGLYRKVNVPTSVSMTDDKTKSEESSDKVEGKEEDPSDEDGNRKLYLSLVMERLPKGIDALAKKQGNCPYLCTIDPDTDELLELRRNWAPDDKRYEPIEHFVEFPFIPWRGAQAIGMPQLISGLTTAMTGALRAILDSGLVNTMPTLVKLKSRPGGGITRLNATGVHEIEGAGAEDVNKVFKQLQFNPPAPLLFEVLGFLDRTTRGVVKTSLEEMSDYNTNVPVGTQLSRVEQGLMTFSSIYARQHFAMAQLLRTVHKLNGIYLQPDEDDEEDPSMATKYGRNSDSKSVAFDPDDPNRVVHLDDYKGSCEMTPVSDPRIFSESQRLAQMQAVDAIDVQNPGIINKPEKVRRQLSLLRIPDYENLIIKQPTPQMTNQAAENVAMAMGQPVMAFPQQDHLAHIQTLLSFMEDPVYGGNPAIEPSFLPPAVQHLKEHMLYLYIDLADAIAKAETGFDPSQLVDPSDPEMLKLLDGLVAAATNHVHDQTKQFFQRIMPIIQKAVEKVQKYQQAALESQMQDPTARVMAAEVNRKREADQANIAGRKEERQIKLQIKGVEVQAQAGKTKADNTTKVQVNTDDNATALAIAGGKTREAGQRISVDRTKVETAAARASHETTVKTASTIAEQQRATREQDRKDAETAHKMQTDRSGQVHDVGMERARHAHDTQRDRAEFTHGVQKDRAEHERQVAADRAKAKNDARKNEIAARKTSTDPNPTPRTRGSDPNPGPK